MSQENESSEFPESTSSPAIPPASDSSINGTDDTLINTESVAQHQAENVEKLRFPEFTAENETFPWQWLPETIRGAVIEIAKNEKVAVSVAVQAALSAVSLACQDLIWIDRGIGEGEKSVCSLYMLTVTDTGSRKSKADSVVTAAIEAYDRQKRTDYERQKEAGNHEQKDRLRKQHDLEKASSNLLKKSRTLVASEKKDVDQIIQRAKSELAKIEQELKDLRQQNLNYQESRLQRVFYSKIPIQQLEKGLAENWPSAGLFSDEAAGILNSRGESDMASLDKLWEGKAIDVVGRTKQETFYIEDPRLTISLMVQPIIFDRFLERKGDLAKGIGFMSRILLSRPDVPYGRRLINSKEQKETYWIKQFNSRILAILTHAHSDITKRAENRKTLYFSPSAQQLWEKDANEMEEQTPEGMKLFHEREFVSRYAEHVARLAALFHFFENEKLINRPKVSDDESVDLAIPEPTVDSAIRIMEWYLNQFKLIFNPEAVMREMAIYVLKKLKDRLDNKNGGVLVEVLGNGDNCRVPIHQLRTYCPRYDLKKSTAKFRLVLDWLVRNGNITIVQNKKMTNQHNDPEQIEINRESSYDYRNENFQPKFFFNVDGIPEKYKKRGP